MLAFLKRVHIGAYLLKPFIDGFSKVTCRGPSTSLFD